MRILVFQTAFIGDVVLTLPVFQILRQSLPDATIDGLVIPRAANLLDHHPAINEVIQYDKRGADKGIAGAWRMVQQIRSRRYDVVIVPHRSLRSALITWLARIPKRIGFDRSSGSFFFTEVVTYQERQHEVERNLSLCESMIGRRPDRILPMLVPTKEDDEVVDAFFEENAWKATRPLVAFAPGTVWNTKRWPLESFAALARHVLDAGSGILLIGGEEDRDLCGKLKDLAGSGWIMNAAGRMTLRQTAASLIRARALVTNDSAPLHLAVAVGTPVVAIFGATVPSLGFAPIGPRDVIVQVDGLSCRPCSLHGTENCPIGTFQCMLDITPQQVFESLPQFLK